MLDIDKIKNYHRLYLERKKALFENNTIKGFIGFMHDEEIKNKKSGVVSMAMRDEARRLKEIKRDQESRKPLDPEEDFKNLK